RIFLPEPLCYTRCMTTAATTSVAGRQRLAIMLALLLFLMLCAPATQLPLGRDALNFLCLGREVALGARPYTDIWDNKPPGMFLLYAVLATVAGVRSAPLATWPVIAGSLAALLATFSMLVVHFRRDRSARGPGMVVAAALLLPTAAGDWLPGQAEIFALPLLVAAYLLGQRWSTRPGALPAFGCGLAAGLLPLLKPQFILAALLPLMVQLPAAYRLSRRAGDFCWWILGMLMPGMLALGWLAVSGSLADAWEAVVLFNLHYQASGVGVAAFAAALLTSAPLTALALAGLGLGAGFLLVARRSPADRAVALWWLGALLAVMIAGRYWLYHWLIVIPATLALVHQLWQRVNPQADRFREYLVLAIILSFALPAGLGPLIDWRAHAAGASATDRLNRRNEAELAALAGALCRQLPGNGRLQYFGYDGELYLLTGQRPATRFFYDFPLFALPPESTLAQRLRARFLKELTARPPERIVIARNDRNPVERESSEQQVAGWPELRAWLAAQYRADSHVDNFLIYTRAPAPAEQAARGQAQ
ncbi:MAG TPA: hypothetical protein PKM88_08085, partial [bacterium]|nr:hypothetical protein [bacterium]